MQVTLNPTLSVEAAAPLPLPGLLACGHSRLAAAATSTPGYQLPSTFGTSAAVVGIGTLIADGGLPGSQHPAPSSPKIPTLI